MKNLEPKKPKKLKDLPPVKMDLSPEELEELHKTESEVRLEDDTVKCIVHKGPIDGAIYLCPRCRTYYCFNCAITIKKNGEKCWTCDSDINIAIPESDVLALVRERAVVEKLSVKTQQQIQKIMERIDKADIALNKENKEKAIKFYKEAKKIAMKANESEISNELAVIISNIQKLKIQEDEEQRRKHLEKEEKVQREGTKEEIEISKVIEQAEAFFAEDDFAGAAKLYAKAAQMAKDIGDKQQVVEYSILAEEYVRIAMEKKKNLRVDK